MKIRNAQTKDLDACIELLKELFSIEKDFEFSYEKHHKGLSMILENTGNSNLLVSDAYGEITGMCSVQLLISSVQGNLSAVIEDVIVKKDQRGSGIGRKLLEAAETWASGKGATRMTLLVDKDNKHAFFFYECLHFYHTNLAYMMKTDI